MLKDLIELIDKIWDRVDWNAAHCRGRFMTVVPLTFFFVLDFILDGSIASYLEALGWEWFPAILTLMTYLACSVMTASDTYKMHPDSLDAELEYQLIHNTVASVLVELRAAPKAAKSFLRQINLDEEKIKMLVGTQNPEPPPQLGITIEKVGDKNELIEVVLEECKEAPQSKPLTAKDFYYVLYEVYNLIHPPHQSHLSNFIHSSLHGLSHMTEVQLLKYFSGINVFDHKMEPHSFFAGALVLIGMGSTIQTFNFNASGSHAKPKYYQLSGDINFHFAFHRRKAKLLGALMQDSFIDMFEARPTEEEIREIAAINAEPGCSMH